MCIDVIKRSQHKSFILPLESRFTNIDKLKDILSCKIVNAIESRHNDFVDGKANKVLEEIDIKKLSILYVPFIRINGSMDVDWSCVEILHDFNRGIDRYVGRTGRSYKEFDVLVPIANVKGHNFGELYTYRFHDIEFKTIKNLPFNDMSDDTANPEFRCVPLDEDEEWIEKQVEKEFHSIANSISYNVDGKTESRHESHKINLDDEFSGGVYYLPIISFKYSYHERDLDWDFLITPEKYSKPISAIEFQDEEDREFIRISINAFKEKLKNEREDKLIEKKENSERILQERHLRDLESEIEKVNNFNFFIEQRNIFFSAIILCVILVLIWLFLILTDNQKHWSQHNLPEILSWLCSFWVISELWVQLFGDSEKSLSSKLSRISDPSPELIESVANKINKLKKMTMIRWFIVVILIILTLIIQFMP